MCNESSLKVYAFSSGYDTTGTSPGSTRSSFSSIKEQSPNEASPTHSEATPPHQQHQPIDNNLSKLLVDPVKLIDDRIKVNIFTYLK